MKTKTRDRENSAALAGPSVKRRARRQRGRAKGKRRCALTGWDAIEALAGTVEGPEDWAAEHDHYIHGTPKRGGGAR